MLWVEPPGFACGLDVKYEMGNVTRLTLKALSLGFLSLP